MIGYTVIISRATDDQWPEIERFLKRARHVYADAGLEDLPGLIRSGLALVGKEKSSGRESLCALLTLQRDPRPTTLPTDAPDREILRYAALGSNCSPYTDLPLLMERAWPLLAEQGSPFQVQAYGSQRWIVNPLLACGFAVEERIEFLRLSGLQTRSFANRLSVNFPRSSAGTAVMRPASSDDLAPLAELDAAAFPPRWHFGEDALFTLFFSGTIQLAFLDGQLAGYWAQTPSVEGEAHLARLAVHPALHGRGIGRLLVSDAIRYARAEKFQSIQLNTQTDNQAAQALYRSFGFRPTGRIVPVLTRRHDETLAVAPQIQ